MGKRVEIEGHGEWPCNEKCGRIVLNSATLQWYDMKRHLPVEQEENFCMNCGSERPPHKPAPAEVWMGMDVKKCTGSEDYHLTWINKASPGLRVQIRREVEEISELIDCNIESPAETALRIKTNEIIRALNSLRNIEGELFVKVEKP